VRRAQPRVLTSAGALWQTIPAQVAHNAAQAIIVLPELKSFDQAINLAREWGCAPSAIASEEFLDGIEAVPLRDPITQLRWGGAATNASISRTAAVCSIVTPCRGLPCRHMSCFDLRAFLQIHFDTGARARPMNLALGRPARSLHTAVLGDGGKCPHCKTVLKIDDLFVDGTLIAAAPLVNLGAVGFVVNVLEANPPVKDETG
jgi:hypothetical protein